MSDKTTCSHKSYNSYWTTVYDNCMVCRAEKAEQQLATARRAVWEEAAKLAENEPELEGPIPVGIRIALEQYSLEGQQRLAVRATKRGIADKCRQQAKEAQP